MLFLRIFFKIRELRALITGSPLKNLDGCPDPECDGKGITRFNARGVRYATHHCLGSCPKENRANTTAPQHLHQIGQIVLLLFLISENLI